MGPESPENLQCTFVSLFDCLVVCVGVFKKAKPGHPLPCRLACRVCRAWSIGVFVLHASMTSLQRSRAEEEGGWGEAHRRQIQG